ncbi:OmpA family protein [Geomonas sp. Red32]|uniref:OmpA family protein n=1 Tax=Geomonas sp. Red32 TaxID=2912856 RepID=UPI00202CA7D5|nr:OmpA family protein [Geomonas sp. Red32]MCM0080341.1 OmpA family protein [Geomonas sp. Red32]
MRSRYMLYLSGLAVLMMAGCANYEVNSKRNAVPGHLIRTEMQDSDRALDAAQAAGKDKSNPEAFQAAKKAHDDAYDVYRACHTEEGAAMARVATAKAKELMAMGEPGTKAAAVAPQSQPMAEAAPMAVPVATAAPAANTKNCVALNIQFDIGQAEIRPEYRDEVRKVGAFLQRFPTTTAVIAGYTDEVGSDDFNLKLSQARAESVVKELEDDYGIAPDRLSAKGYGKSYPVATNSTDPGRQRNRRIDAIIDCAFDVTAFMGPPETLCMTLNAHFNTGSAELRPADFEAVDRVGAYLKEHPAATAVIQGHTDNTGTTEENMRLSKARAESIVNYLAAHFSIDPSRLTAEGYGSSHNIAYNGTASGRQMNRRINAIINCAT